MSEILIPALSDGNGCETKLFAERIDSKVQNAGYVGTGISCGVDSMHVLKKHLKDGMPGFRLTHLTVNDVGAFGKGTGQFRRSLAVAENVAKETGLGLIPVKSNIMDFVDYPFMWCHTFMNSFAVLALGKFWRTFFYGSSGYSFAESAIAGRASLEQDCALYENLLLPYFSTVGTRLLQEGAAKDRFDKIADIAGFDLAQKHLNVCVSDTGRNCGKCEKCRRTLLILDALGVLDEFGDVFDIAEYRNDRWKHLGWALYRKWTRSGSMTNRALAMLDKDIGLKSRIYAAAGAAKRVAGLS